MLPQAKCLILERTKGVSTSNSYTTFILNLCLLDQDDERHKDKPSLVGKKKVLLKSR